MIKNHRYPDAEIVPEWPVLILGKDYTLDRKVMSTKPRPAGIISWVRTRVKMVFARR